MRLDFGFYPRRYDHSFGEITISTLPELDEKVGLSAGMLDTEFCFIVCGGVRTTAVWGNAEIGFEVVRSTGMFFRSFVGYEKELARGPIESHLSDPDNDPPFDVPYFGMSIGHAY
jgi:hypothetical protein